MHVLSSRILLRPRDFARSLAFYEDGLGLARYREWGRPPARGVVLFLGGGFLELTEGHPDPPPQGVRLWLQVASLEEARSTLEVRGVAVAEPPERKPWGLIEMSVLDPDGLELILIEVPDDHPLRRRD